jgi:uncharacterized lipoprotein YajG
MNVFKIITIAVASAFISGCAFVPQEANIDPNISMMPSSEGHGVTVSVKVLDERPSKSLGHRVTAYGKAAEITSAQDVAVVVHEKIVYGLQAKGFDISDFTPESPIKLQVELRLLEYSTSTGFWTGGVHVKGAIKVVADKNGSIYEKMYRTEDEERVVVVPDASSNEKMINEGLAALLMQIFEDNALFAHLAK